MNRIRKFVALALLLPFLAIGCSAFVKNNYIALDGTAITYGAAAIGAKKAWTSVKITDDQWAKINQGGKIFHAAFDVAVDGLKAYKNNSSTTTQDAAVYAISQLLANWVDLAALINSIVPGSVPVSSMNVLTLKGKMASGEKLTISIKKLDTGEISIIIELGGAILQYLIPAISNLINDMAKITISDEDLDALKNLVKDPDQY